MGKILKNSTKKEFDSESGYNEKYLKAKTKCYNGKINTNFHNNKIPKEVVIYLSIILINFVLRIGNNYYSQVFVEECKHVINE